MGNEPREGEEYDETVRVNWVFWEPKVVDRMKIALDAMSYQTERDSEAWEERTKGRGKR